MNEVSDLSKYINLSHFHKDKMDKKNLNLLHNYIDLLVHD
jgi:hypothetical protein